MKKTIIIFLIVFVLKISFSYADNEWVEQIVPRNCIVTDIQFLNDTLGFYCARYPEGYLGKTTNGGNNWEELIVWGSRPRNCLYFFNENHGIIAGWWAFPEKWVFAIAITYDGGYTFQWPSGPDTQELYFLDSLHGWSASDYSIGYTSDCCSTWTIYNLNCYNVCDICFSDSFHGWVVGNSVTDNTAIIVTSSDGGISWKEETIVPGNSILLSGISFPDSLNGWIVGDSGTIFHTSDGGFSWIQQNSGRNSFLRDVYFYNENIGWIAGDYGTLLKTTNGGDEWIDQNPNTYNDLYNIFFLDSLKGWVGGYNIILHTECGGCSVEEEFSGLNPSDNYIDIYPISLTQNYLISFHLSVNSYVRIEIFNVLGQKIKTLVEECKNASRFEIIWNSMDDHGIPVLSGSYFLRLEAGDFKETKSFIVIR